MMEPLEYGKVLDWTVKDYRDEDLRQRDAEPEGRPETTRALRPRLDWISRYARYYNFMIYHCFMMYFNFTRFSDFMMYLTELII